MNLKKNQNEICRQTQFMEIMEGVKWEEGSKRFHSGQEYFQAVFISVKKLPSDKNICKMQVIKDFLKKEACNFFYYRDFIVVLFENTPEAAVRHVLEKLCVFLAKSKEQFAVTLGSRCLEDDASGKGILQTCREAEDLMEMIFFHNGKKYLSMDDLRRKKDTRMERDIASEIKKICTYIQVVDYNKIHSFFNDLKDYFFYSGKSAQEVRQECMELMIEIRNDNIRKFPVMKEMMGTGREIFSIIMNTHYLDTVIDAMSDICRNISETLPLLSSGLSFQRILSYVKNNYNENLKLETLGRLFYCNSAYLGKSFKKYTGKNFNTYLDLLRIDMAKELLQKTGMKVYEISSTVGYGNTDYFFSKFKKYTGISPLVFRKSE